MSSNRNILTAAALTIAIGIIALIALAQGAMAAPPCGTPNGGPCPTSTPGSNPTATPPLTATATPNPGGWTLVWSDEFDGPNINSSNWTYDIGWGQNGWGNAELQYYTDRTQNARIENGMLVIEARKERFRAQQYTSARLKTQSLQTFTYGRIEARMQLPYGQGIWPAFWSLGSDITEVGWPNSGEIDIMEHIGREPQNIYGTVHGPGYSGADSVGNSYTLTSGSVSTEFHVYAIEWEPDEIRWYIDDILYGTITPDDVPGMWVFDHDFFLILNVAVGGYWPGYPDETTIFPQFMRVDYVRVYQ